jgi:hypothetical protein
VSFLMTICHQSLLTLLEPEKFQKYWSGILYKDLLLIFSHIFLMVKE